MGKESRSRAGLASTGSRLSLDASEFQALRDLIRQHTGISLGESKQPMLVARLGRRLRHLGLESFTAYIDLLTHGDPHGEELQNLIHRVTTHTTSFFRERHHFEFLASQVFQTSRPQPGPIRIWSCAASTGQEPYSIAMTARNSLGQSAAARLEIVASDVDAAVLQTARAGIYQAGQLAHLPNTLWQPHCLRGRGSASGLIQAAPQLRELIRWLPLNLTDSSWPELGLFDVIFCRNLIIYFDAAMQATVLKGLEARLRPGGFLVLGHSESLPSSHSWMSCVSRTVYRLDENVAGAQSASASSAHRPTDPVPSSLPPTHQSITAGEVFVSAENDTVRTCLGSCVAACLFDPDTGVGGMNHFALPTSDHDSSSSCRYGVHAMEVLINELMAQGAARHRLRAKVFGGCEVLKLDGRVASVAAQNARFVIDFLATEGIPVVAHRLGGDQALDLIFDTGTGRARVRALSHNQTTSAAAAEADPRFQRPQAIARAVPPLTGQLR